jgi:hypothetical protein
MGPLKFTASKLRRDIYNILDGIIASRAPVAIERKAACWVSRLIFRRLLASHGSGFAAA